MRKQVAVVPADQRRLRARAPSPEVIEMWRIIRSDSFSAEIDTASLRRTKASEYLPAIEKLMIERQYYSLRLPDVAYLLDLESTYCSSVFPEICGTSFCKWLRALRIRMAMRLLRETRFSVTHISHLVGYKEVTTFNKNFRKQVDMCPREYRQSCENGYSGLTPA